MRIYLCQIQGVHHLLTNPSQHIRDLSLMREIQKLRRRECNAETLPDEIEDARFHGAWSEPLIIRMSKWTCFTNRTGEAVVREIFRQAFRNGSDTIRTQRYGTSIVVSSIPSRMIAGTERWENPPAEAHEMFMDWALGYVVAQWGATQLNPIPNFPDLQSARSYFQANP